MRAPNKSSSPALLAGVLVAIVAGPCVARDPTATEAQLAKELFVQIAEQSGCQSYAVSWLDLLRNTLRTQCADSLTLSKALAADLPPKVPRFIADVAALRTAAPAPGQRLGWPSNVLAYRLSRSQGVPHDEFAWRAPMIVYDQERCSSEDLASTPSTSWLIRADKTLR